MSEPQNNTTGELAFSSSLKEARWHDQQGHNAFERWHFDALSDDGREALVIAFHDNFGLSPRYFSQERSVNGGSSQSAQKFPAVSFSYSVDGKTVFRTVNEFGPDEFSAPDDGIGCLIGASSFRVEAASYGSGFVLQIDLLTTRKRRIQAELEWLSIESDLSKPDAGDNAESACWNMAVPRSDVSGRITLLGRRGNVRKLIHFRGTGYHDHFRSCRSLNKTVGSHYWGRAHFVDSTTVFHHHEIQADERAHTKLFLIRDGAIDEREAASSEAEFIQNRFGLRLPDRLSILSNDGVRLEVVPIRLIQPGFFEAKFLTEMTLMLPDGKPRKTLGLTEIIKPAKMRSRFLRRLADMRIGKNGKGPIL